MARASAPAPTDPTLARMVRMQVAEAKVAKLRKAMLDEPVEDLTDAETAPIKEGGGGQTLTATGRDKMTLWHVQTGVPSKFMYYEVGKRLQDEDGNGNPVWTLDESAAAERKGGTYMCYLNPAHENFDTYFDIVGQVCGEAHGMNPKAGIPNRFQQRRHMQLKHRNAWEAIREEEERLRREEDRELQRDTARALAAVRGREEGRDGPVSD